DTPGTLHHVMVRGIERQSIVTDDDDRENFVTRMGELAMDTGTSIYAWALMDNHAHILLKSGEYGLPAYMRRLLSGYASSFNRRHKRHGHLFQNRYKSIICEEDPYFKELVRYIHLNPLRAKVAGNLSKLDYYKWCGHSVIMDHRRKRWQDREYVLKNFGAKKVEAKKAYRNYVKKGIKIGKREDLTGGGLIRSMGWSVVKAMRKAGENENSDERILGSGKFVSEIIRQADEKLKYQVNLNDVDKEIMKEIKKCCRKEGVTVKFLQSGSRRQPLPKLRKALAEKLVNDYCVSLAETARRLGVSTSGVSQMLRR
ncbi:transposase, partial [Candidatus Magnetomorum sp. HK-1]